MILYLQLVFTNNIEYKVAILVIDILIYIYKID